MLYVEELLQQEHGEFSELDDGDLAFVPEFKVAEFGIRARPEQQVEDSVGPPRVRCGLPANNHIAIGAQRGKGRFGSVVMAGDGRAKPDVLLVREDGENLTRRVRVIGNEQLRPGAALNEPSEVLWGHRWIWATATP